MDDGVVVPAAAASGLVVCMTDACLAAEQLAQIASSGFSH